MKLLSICIPTYNRNKELTELAHNFLIPALQAFPEMVEIFVCDNSDDNVALANQSVLDNRIQYRKNELNMGFSGNLLRCAAEATATYIWIISDNDPILWAGFVELMDTLPQANITGIDCVMLPFQTSNNFGDKVISNRHTDWGLPQQTTMATLLKTGQIPFVLFSSVVVRLDKRTLPEIKVRFFNNDYLQVILFLEMLGKASPVLFTTTNILEYQPEYLCRYPIISIANSMSRVRVYLHDKFGLPRDEKRDYGGWLMWLIHHRGGLYQIKDADQERWGMIAKLPRNFSVKNLVLACALVIPSVFFRPVYIWYRSYKDMKTQGRYSLAEFRQRVTNNYEFIESQRR